MNNRTVITSAASAAQAAGHAAASARIGMFAPSGLLEEIPGTARVEIPSPASIAEALAVAGRARYYTDPVFPDCFVCGIGRRPGDGLRIFPAPVAGRPLWAAPWTPDPSVASADGRVRPEVVWAGARLPQRDRRRRGRQSGGGHCHHARPDDGQSDALPLAGDPYRLIAWPSVRDGRKLTARSALLGPGGETLAGARAVWLTVPRPVPAPATEGAS